MRWISAFVIVLIASGCETMHLKAIGRRPDPAAEAPTVLADDQPQPALQAEPTERQREVMALVNGKAVYMDRLHDLLVLAGGRKMAHNIVAWELVDQEATERSITVTETDTESEHQATLKRMFPQVADATDREALLGQLMAREGISQEQWRISMRMHAQLTKILSAEIEVTDEEMQQAFADRYGRKVAVRHIQFASLADAENALRQLKAGADFAQLARKVSKHASAANGGLLPPVSATAKLLPRALHKEAWAMTRKGQIAGPVQAGTSYHLLFCDQVTPPTNVAIEDVADEVTQAVKRGKLRLAKDRFLQGIIGDADIQWVNPLIQQSNARPSGQVQIGQP